VGNHQGAVLQMQLADANQELDLARKEKVREANGCCC